MTSLQAAAVGRRCPSLAELREFDAGLLPVARSEEIARHLLECPLCEATYEELDRSSDTLTRALERMPIRPDDEVELRRVQSELLESPEDLGNIYIPVDRDEPTYREPSEDGTWPQIPARLGVYELIELLGQGATSSVFRARHARLDRDVAIKVFTTPIHDESVIERFRAEMQAVGRLDHPNIIRATDAGEASGFHYLVMEYVRGVDLSTLLHRTGPLSVANACELVLQAARGLQGAHEFGMVHRDIKPSNLLLTSTGIVKILDLGLVSFRPGEGASESAWDDRPRGTADYMAPEQWTHFAEVDIRGDLYSLGCTLHKLITGKAPFRQRAAEFRSRMQAHLQAPIPGLRDAAPAVPVGLDRIHRRLLAKDRAERFSTPAELVEALEPFAEGHDLAPLLKSVGLEPQLQAQPGERAPKKPPSKVFNRRNALTVGVALGLPLAWNLWHLRPELPLRSSREWRELRPRTPIVLLSSESGMEDKAAFDELSGVLAIGPISGLVLVHLGQPTTRSYTISANLIVPTSGSCGLFFDYLMSGSGASLQHLCQTISIRRTAENGSTGEWRLAWQDLIVQDESKVVRWTTRAEAAIPGVGESAHTIEVALNQTGFPEVSWDGTRLPQSAWNYQWDRRATEAESGARLRRLHAGRLGVFAENCETTWSEMRLRY